MQSALLLLLLNRVPHPVIHRLLGANHKAIEDMAKRLRDLRMRWVQKEEKKIDFGAGKNWSEVLYIIFGGSKHTYIYVYI